MASACAFLGAQASTNVRLGPQHLLEHIFGGEPMLGDDADDATANLHAIMMLWNELVRDHERGRVRLSEMPLPNTPDRAALAALAERRSQEILWFTRGIDAGGDDPIEFGADGQDIMRGLAEAAAFCDAYLELLGRQDPTPKESAETAAGLDRLTATVQKLMNDLMTISDGVRRHAIDQFRALGDRKPTTACLHAP